MATLNLRRGRTGSLPASIAHWHDSSSSLGRALGSLMDDVRAGRVTTTDPGDQWLVLRIEEALRGYDDIRVMAGADEHARRPSAAGAGAASILAERAQAS